MEFKKKKKISSIYLRERVHNLGWEGGEAGRQGEADAPLSRQPDMELNPRTPRL